VPLWLEYAIPIEIGLDMPRSAGRSLSRCVTTQNTCPIGHILVRLLHSCIDTSPEPTVKQRLIINTSALSRTAYFNYHIPFGFYIVLALEWFHTEANPKDG
jgi:hypothetical protein